MSQAAQHSQPALALGLDMQGRDCARVHVVYASVYVCVCVCHAGTGVMSNEQQEVALEGILDLVRTPGFVHDVFVNCDCR